MGWSEINILNKHGMLTSEDRKQPLEHGCDWVTFKSCVDLSEGVKVIPYGTRGQISVQQYSQDLASFMCWWERNVMCDLNGFSGFSHVKFFLEGFELVDTNKVTT
jgi:hypothetical protein